MPSEESIEERTESTENCSSNPKELGASVPDSEIQAATASIPEDENKYGSLNLSSGLLEKDREEEQNLQTESQQDAKDSSYPPSKTLTSRFRGVCWNKKNKRWQSAINSGGRYLYLGSYDTEDEAARMFDKAAVRIRGIKARLNYHYKEYIDVNGNVLPDPLVEALLADLSDPVPIKINPHIQKRKEAESRDDCVSAPALRLMQMAHLDMQPPALAPLIPGQNFMPQVPSRMVVPGSQDASKDIVKQAKFVPSAFSRFITYDGQLPSSANLSSSGMHMESVPYSSFTSNNQFSLSSSLPLRSSAPSSAGVNDTYKSRAGPPGNSTAVSLAVAKEVFAGIQRQLPEGGTLESAIPCDSEQLLGVLYTMSSTTEIGSGVWIGTGFYDCGLYTTSKDAKLACWSVINVMNIVSEDPSKLSALLKQSGSVLTSTNLSTGTCTNPQVTLSQSERTPILTQSPVKQSDNSVKSWADLGRQSTSRYSNFQSSTSPDFQGNVNEGSGLQVVPQIVSQEHGRQQSMPVILSTSNPGQYPMYVQQVMQPQESLRGPIKGMRFEPLVISQPWKVGAADTNSRGGDAAGATASRKNTSEGGRMTHGDESDGEDRNGMHKRPRSDVR